MKLLVFVLNRPERIDDVLSAYVECGIPGATIVDSVGMGHFLARYVPVFAGFQSLMVGNRAANKTILSVIQDETKVPRVLAVIEEILGPLDQAGAGIAFTLPVDDVRGLRLEGEEGAEV